MLGWIRRSLGGSGIKSSGRARNRTGLVPSAYDALEHRQVMSTIPYAPAVVPPNEGSLNASPVPVTLPSTVGATSTAITAAIPTVTSPGATQPAMDLSATPSAASLGGAAVAGPTYYYGQPVIQASVTVRASSVAPISYAGQPVVVTPTALTADAAEADYVGALYHAVLDRTGTTSEIDQWVAAMDTGLTAPQVAAAFVNSVEHRQEEVNTYYQEFLNRTPDSIASAWVNELLSGATEESVVESILGSPEYQAEHPSTDQFVQGLYVDLLGRQGSPQNIAAWDAALNSGMSRTAVIADFVNSPEAVDQVLDGFYADYLGRTPEPSTSNVWVQMLESSKPSATAVAVSILSSPEFIQDSTKD